MRLKVRCMSTWRSWVMVSNSLIETKPLGDIVEKIVGGGTPSRKKTSFYNGNIPWATVKDLKGQHLKYTLEYITEEAIKKSSANLIEKGTVIIATRMALGKAFINLVDMAINQDLKALYPKPFVDNRFLLYSLLNKSTKIKTQGSGTTVKGIRLEYLKAMPIGLPPLKEQQKIAAILSFVDEAIEITLQILEQTEEVKKGLMQQLLTRGIGNTKFKETPIGEIPEEWEVLRFDEVFDIDSGMSFSRAQLGEEGHLYLHYGDIHKTKKHFFDTSLDDSWLPKVAIKGEKIKKSSLLRNGDIVISDASEDTDGVGKSVAIINKESEKFISGLHTMVVRDSYNKLTTNFKGYVFLNPLIRKQFIRIATGATVYGINKTNIKQLYLPIPSREEQSKISNLLVSIDQKIDKESLKLTALNSIKQGLLQDLLTGKVRVPIDDEEVVET